MKFIKWIMISCLWTYSTYAVNIKKEGLIPSYNPCDIGVMLLFVPYNPTVIAIGDHIADFASAFAHAKECGNIYGCTADAHDFARLNYFENQLPNLRSFLFDPSYHVPTFNFSIFCEAQKLNKIHVIHLDCGGNELRVLKSIQKYLKDGIVVFLKTYHQEIREGISPFQQIHELMTNQGYELFSHYIYDGVVGDALYVKNRYVSAVFRSKEL